MKRIELETSNLVNVLKFVLVVPLIVVTSVIFKIFSFYGTEFVLMGAILGAIAWLYRIKFVGRLDLQGHTLDISVKMNVLGHAKLKISSNELGLERLLTTRECCIDLQIAELDAKLRFSNLRSRPPILEVMR